MFVATIVFEIHPYISIQLILEVWYRVIIQLFFTHWLCLIGLSEMYFDLKTILTPRIYKYTYQRVHRHYFFQDLSIHIETVDISILVSSYHSAVFYTLAMFDRPAMHGILYLDNSNTQDIQVHISESSQTLIFSRSVHTYRDS